jgi:type I restriction enzyme S subunit
MNQAVQLPLQEVGEVTAGPSGSLLENLHDGPDGVPVISPPDVTEAYTVDARRVRRVPRADARKLSRFALSEGDLLMVRQGTLGRLALIAEEQAAWLYNSSFLRISPKRDLVLPEYLVAYLSHPPVRRRLLGQSLPGTVPSLNSAILNELPVIVPPIKQQRIAINTLSDIDSVIRVQQAITDHLSSLRPAIFGKIINESEYE